MNIIYGENGKVYISPISFYGKYRAYYTDPNESMPFRKTKRYTEIAGGKVEAVPIYPDSRGYYPRSHGNEVYLMAKADCPDEMSERMFQGNCAVYNIKYVKEGDETLLDADGIRRRTKKGDGARNTAFLADFDLEKFEEAIEKQKNSNLSQIEEQYEEDEEIRKQADDFILSGLDIPAPVLYITPRKTEDVDAAAQEIKDKGMNNIDDDALDIKFDQITDGPDQCLYFVMKKFGVKKFPVCVMPDTYKIGAAAGFLSPATKPTRSGDKAVRITY